MAEKILVVDDEHPIADILKFNLQKEGYQVVVAHNGEEALELFRREQPDLVILDIMLPKVDGLTVCRILRQTSRVPILMLTAREEEVDVVLGLELGADDYVTKPFSPRELVARVKAILRRSAPPPEGQTGRLHFDDLVLDLDAYALWRGEQEVPLTPREFQLLRHLATHPGQVFNRDGLCREVWGYDYFGDARTVDVTIRRLREKIEPDPARPEYIKTKRGVGYYFQRP